MTGRATLRGTFNSAAELYHRARPRYPELLFDALDEYAGTGVPADILEIGPATGVATIPLAHRGHRITGIELGADLAAHARANTADLPNVSIVAASFDVWEPPTWQAFDLVVAATSWHWLDPKTKYQRAHRHLRAGGALSFWSALHVVPENGDSLFAELQDVYDQIGESLPSDRVFPRPGDLPDATDEIDASGLFGETEVRHFDWEIIYDAESYIDLLNTFSGHIAMEQWKRDRLYSEIRRRVAERPDQQLRRNWGAVLHMTRRR